MGGWGFSRAKDMVVKQILKLVVAVVLMGALLWMVDWSEAGELIRRLQWWVLIPLLVVMVFELGLSALKWLSALRMHGLHYRFGYLFRTLCAGYFFNNFLPTAVGGDAYRVYRTLPSDGYRSRAISAVMVERLTGFAALLTLGAVGALFLLGGPARIAETYLVVYILGGIAGLAGLGALYAGWFRGLTERLKHLKAVDAILHNLGRLATARRGWVEQALMSFFFQAISIGIVYWLFMHTGEPLGYWECALITAAAGLAAFLPLSINGIGITEGSMVGMALALGVGYDQALLVALVRRMMMFALSLLCGLVYLTEGRPSDTDETAGPNGAQAPSL